MQEFIYNRERIRKGGRKNEREKNRKMSINGDKRMEVASEKHE